MRRKLLISLVLAVPFALVCNAEETSTVAPAKEATAEITVKGAHPWKTKENTKVATELAHWSLIWNVGFNSFDGDFNSEMQHPVWVPSVGMGLEYSFTPNVGIGIEYLYDRYRVTGKQGHADALLHGQMHKVDAYLSWDLMAQFFPKAERKILSIQTLLGGGAGIHKYDLAYDDNTRGHTLEATPIAMDKFKTCPFLMGGVNFEFNLSRGVSLGVRGEYSYFMRDDIDGRGTAALASKNNDGIFDVTLNLRYKIDAVHKTHVRNIPSERIIDRQNAAKERTIQAGRDTIIIHRHDSVIYRIETQDGKALPVPEKEDIFYFVYFDNGRATLSKDAVIAVQQLATRMQYKEDCFAVITGYCDNTGSESRNNVLSSERANVVAQELVEEHDINADRIAVCGRGIITNKSGKKVAFAANRRAEIQLVSKEEFDRFIQSCEQFEKQISTKESEPEKQEVLNTTEVTDTSDRTDVIDEVVVKQNITLANLSRKYYQNNTHCWVFIYKANKDVISNPNSLKEGTKLIIPKLTEEQLNISKEECLKIYHSL